MLKFVKGAVVGAAAAYVFDPDRGRSRRARLQDQLLAAGRKGTRWAGRRTRYSFGRAKGRALRSVGIGQFDAADDRALADHLRGVMARLRVPTEHLTTEVVDGVVRVRGEIASMADADVVLSAMACEPGIRHIENLMHLPGQLPPNKAAGLEASGVAAGRRRAG